MASRILNLRRPDVCVGCGSPLASGDRARWDQVARTVTCPRCWEVEVEPGASLAREHQRRKAKREARTRAAHPRIGGLLLALRDAPQHERAFRQGELGERTVAASLEKRTADGPASILHNRRMPGGRGDIDHLAIAPTGVFVIDAKAHRGKVRVANPLFGQPRLLVAGRNRTRLIDGLERQLAAVGAALIDSGCADVPTQGVLCFMEADLPVLGTMNIRGHLVLYPRAVAKRLNAPGPLAKETIDAVGHTLSVAFPPA
jgi:hypothetical protein